MNDIFVLSHLAVVSFIPIHQLYGENQKNVELKKLSLGFHQQMLKKRYYLVYYYRGILTKNGRKYLF